MTCGIDVARSFAYSQGLMFLITNVQKSIYYQETPFSMFRNAIITTFVDQHPYIIKKQNPLLVEVTNDVFD